MRVLAAFILQGRGQAVLVISTLMILSWGLSLASLFSGAALALTTLRWGAREGSVMIMAAVPIVLVASWLLLNSSLQAIGYALVFWVAVWLAAVLLRESGWLSLALVGIVALGLFMVGGVYAFSDDPTAMWLEEMQSFIYLLSKERFEAEVETLQRSMVELSRYLTGAATAGLVLAVSLSLLIARWWQAMLFNPGGFRTEFLSLRMPAFFAYVWLGLLAFAWIAGGNGAELGANLAISFFVPFLLTGFAVLHALFSCRSTGRLWLAGIYLALIFVSPVIMVIMLIGFSDTWINWRYRLSQA